ncbi:hypothetical protein [Xenorhabdus ishibashii]|uniref:Uncharacterized protein n=1 Tax=Xenorhabdus ishibashii TaxID=1034471 RepID=A0A2D0KD25_9GAMM|nr:hypothetical protein [Xenorhabdus ishibashii]PHM61215.1 hypothetical protein Xish_00337 [Xenorhabdus ishibashii]
MLGAALVLVVLVCGYFYTSNHLPSRFKQKEAIGWNAYFDVALNGSLFLIQGIALSIVVWIILFLLMFFLNIPLYLGCECTPFRFAFTIFNSSFLGLKMPLFLTLGMTIAICISSSRDAAKEFSNPEKRRKLYREIASHNSVEKILLESIDMGLLVLVSLKSRKVYVGMVDESRFESLDTATLVIFPFLSGYRDKDTLTFYIENNYAIHYFENNITFDSQPLSVYHYRHALPREQIESISLFDTSTYYAFQSKLKKEENKTLDMDK